MHDNHKSFSTNADPQITSSDQNNFVPFSELNWKKEQDHFVITVFNDEDMENVAYWVHLKPETTQDDAEAQAKAHSKPAMAEWITVKTLETKCH